MVSNFTSGQIAATSYAGFLPFLRTFFLSDVEAPARPHYRMPSSAGPSDLLLMPAWNDDFLGIKIVTVHPENPGKGLPAIQGSYQLTDVHRGLLLATFDAPALTAVRTAAVSALAADILCGDFRRQNMLMIGTGTMCLPLIKAHMTIQDLKSVRIWGRNPDKAKVKVRECLKEGIPASLSESPDPPLSEVDLICTATSSVSPLVCGQRLAPGTHLDLVGSFRRDMREADDDCLRRSTLFVDVEEAQNESGDLYLPMKEGVINREDIAADLRRLCAEGYRRRPDEITLFKSVGSALSDLALAVYLYKRQKQMKV